MSWVRSLTPDERKNIRLLCKVSRAMMARDLGCSEGTIVRYEGGDREPTGGTGARYARLLRKLWEANTSR